MYNTNLKNINEHSTQVFFNSLKSHATQDFNSDVWKRTLLTLCLNQDKNVFQHSVMKET